MAYPVGGIRDVSLYNDEQFVDEPPKSKDKQDFIDYLNSKEELIQSGGDIAPNMDKLRVEEMSTFDKKNL